MQNIYKYLRLRPCCHCCCLELLFAVSYCCQVFVFAGHETSSNTLNFALLELIKHPEHIDPIREEVAKLLDIPDDGLLSQVCVTLRLSLL